VNWAACFECETIECSKSCAANSLKQCVRFLTVEELIRILLRDFANWGSDGGVTFTGGEPLVQYEYLLAVLKRCRELQMHTAIETSGYASREVFLKVMESINFAFVDVKNMDDEKHRWGTGVGNEPILSNIAALARSNWGGRLVIRQPTIHGFNDDTENALKLIEFMNENGLYEINLLKFHRMGGTKWEQLGKPYEYADHGDMTDERMKELQKLYLDSDIACYLGEDTPF
jgi:Pyruvate-formate lyase-activating enzyme